MSMQKLRIIAGPCSVDNENIKEIEEILSIEINGKRAIFGARVVGLKSRTELNYSGSGMGMDFESFMHNMDIIASGGSINDFKELPSILIAKDIQQKFNCLIATEIMDPSIQMPLLEKHLKGDVMPWNPAVSQLGWPMLHVSKYSERNNWHIGIKNPKNLGITRSESEENNIQAPLEKVWKGVSTYSKLPNEKKILIHRGVDCPSKGDFRSALIHNSAKRTKSSIEGCQLFFDPSHSYGPKLRDIICEETIKAMNMKDDLGEFLYDGLLIETGTSKTDTHQHITIDELRYLVNEVSKFRDL